MTVDLSRLRAMYAAATPGKWKTWRSSTPDVLDVVTVSKGRIECHSVMCTIWEHDAALIVAMHSALPKLLDELEAARKVVEAARDMVRTEKSYERDVFRAACRAYDDAVKP